MRVIKKTVSACGSVIRVLMGAGALALFVIGIRNKTGKNLKDTGSGKPSSREGESKKR